MLNRMCFSSSIVVLALTTVLTMAASSRAGDAFTAQPAEARYAVAPLEQVTLIETLLPDREELRQEDEVRRMMGEPPRFAVPQPMFVTPDTDGRWEELPDGNLLWRLRVGSPGAESINLGFGQYHMPKGGRLLLYAEDGTHLTRAFTDADNAAHGQLWTPIVPADAIVVEVVIPASARGDLWLELTSVNAGYRGLGSSKAEGGTRSGSCNVDVVCPEGDAWADEIQSVAVYTLNGFWTCTGAMVNNTAFDRTPYFLTADHCGISSGNASTMVVYWNHENSTCRPVGSSGGAGDGPLDQFQTGAIWRADYGPSDFCLVELEEEPDPAWNVYYAGWDRSENDYASAVAIHHPDTQEKRISFEDDPTSTTSYLGSSAPGDGTHVRVEDWDLGTTEPGSSGSPLFNPDHRIVGQLHGGYAACGNDDADWYGRISVSWNGGGSDSSRLSTWLDPLGTAPLTLNGTGLAEPPVTAGSNVQMGPDTPKTITLQASDLNNDPLTYIITNLPIYGTLSDPGAGTIQTAPYSLVNYGNQVVYTPQPGHTGTDAFRFKVNDGTPPPDGGDSNLSYVNIQIIDLPPTILTESAPDGMINQPYGPVELAYSGGQGTMTWEIIADVPYYESDLGTNAFAEVGTARNWKSDEGSWTLSLPFDFPYYNDMYDEVRVSPNGMMFFGVNTGSAYVNSDAGLINNVRIAPLWDDLRTSCTGCNIFVDQSAAGEVTVRWKGETAAMPFHPVNVAVTLHDDGAIDFHYGPGNTGVTATVGVSDGDGERYTFASYNPATALAQANSIRFKKPDQLSPGMSLSSAGVVSGTPTAPGMYTPLIRVTDGLDRSDEVTLPIFVASILGDANLDGKVDASDLAAFTPCLAGPGSVSGDSECLDVFDFDNDAKIDLRDYAALQMSCTPQ